jgi:iron complex outermembrane receptor protein
VAVVAACVLAAAAAAQDDRELTELTLEELMNVEVTLPSRRPASRTQAAAAVAVITNEDIRRSGFRHLPDVLRLAPGVQVASITSSQWAVGVRGFASRLARSVLVLMDGRSVYTPLFAGTYWEVQDAVLQDIDRIEVVRGPGGTLWGANAVNGVINIVSRPARETQGLLALGGGGSEERGFGTLRYGGQLGDDVYYRVYGKYFYRAAFPDPGGNDSDDAWQMGRGGFRLDWEASEADALTLQGDAYDGVIGQSTPIVQYEPPFAFLSMKDVDVSGANLLGRWNHAFSPTSDLVVQTYYDHTFRREPNFTEERNTWDIEAQHRFTLPWRQEILWGLDYRLSDDSTHGIPTVEFVPPSRTLHLFSFFLQDDIWIVPERLRVSIGSKFETTTYTDFDYQPSGSVLWMPAAQHWLWGSISRAVRTPSRIEHDLLLTAQPFNAAPPDNVVCLPPGSPCTYPRITRNPDFEPETVLAYQVGYRVQPVERLFIDLASFYNQYDNLLTLETGAPFPEEEPPLPHVIVPFVFANQLHGESYGVEIAATAQLTDWWRVSGQYSYLQISLQQDRGSTDISQEAAEDASPHNQVSVLSAIDAPWGVRFDTVLRYVDNLEVSGQVIPSYFTFDVRLAMQLGHGVEIAAVGQNLAQAEHREFAFGTEVPRGAYAQVRWEWTP